MNQRIGKGIFSENNYQPEIGHGDCERIMDLPNFVLKQ